MTEVLLAEIELLKKKLDEIELENSFLKEENQILKEQLAYARGEYL